MPLYFKTNYQWMTKYYDNSYSTTINKIKTRASKGEQKLKLKK